ncbi:MAG: 50S ribosomal protein L19e [Candidatus Bathyarchaeia archaeon]
MSLKSQRRLASQILKVGVNRVWIDPERSEDVETAITREEIRKLIHEGAIKALPEKGVSRARAQILHEKRKKGLRRGQGRRSGASGAKVSEKEAWVRKIRVLRRKLREFKENRSITEESYRLLYKLASSGVFASFADMERYIRTHGMWRKK